MGKGKTEAEMNQLREYELKHGRVAMAAGFGLIVEPYIHPLAKSCHLAHPTDPILSGVGLNFAGKAQILGFCAASRPSTTSSRRATSTSPATCSARPTTS